jgi:Mg-chelatase subunit ChlD
VASRHADWRKLAVAAALGATGQLAAPPVAYAQRDSEALASLKLSQASMAFPTMSVYLDARRADGRPVEKLRADQLSATVGSEAVPVTGVQPFDSAGAGVGYIFLVDVSKSLRPLQFDEVKLATQSWIGSLAPKDRGALITLGDSVRVVQNFTADHEVLAAAVDSLRLSDNQTMLHDGLIRAVELGRTVDTALPARRVIVVLSDGLDDAFGGMSEAEVLDRIRTDRVPIYAIGLYQPPRTRRKEEGLRSLGNFARASGGELKRADTTPIAKAYDEMRRRTQQVFAVEISCEKCPRDGLVHRLQISARVESQILTDGLDLRFMPVPTPPPHPSPPPKPPSRWPWVAGIAGAILVAALAGWARWRKQGHQAAGSDLPSVPQRPGVGPSVPGRTAVPPKQPPRIRLTPLGSNSPGEPRTFVVKDRVLIGRSPSEADFPLSNDKEISNVHCALVWQDPTIILKDLGSTNGTSVNGVPIRSERRVEHNDVIRVGRSELRLSILDSQP